MNRMNFLRRVLSEVNLIGGTPQFEAKLIAEHGQTEDRMHLVINDIDVDWLIEGPRREHRSDRFRVNIGMYGCKTQFIQRKDGHFDYPKAARLLAAEIVQREGKMKGQNIRIKNEAEIEKQLMPVLEQLETMGWRISTTASEEPNKVHLKLVLDKRGMRIDVAASYLRVMADRLTPADPAVTTVLQYEGVETRFLSIGTERLKAIVKSAEHIDDKARIVRLEGKTFYVSSGSQADTVLVPDDPESWDDLKEYLFGD